MSTKLGQNGKNTILKIRTVPEIEDTVDARGHLPNQQPVYDKLINAKVQLQLGDDITSATGSDGKTIVTYNDNPILNLIVYEVEFPDRQVKEYSANTIAENMLIQVNSDGFTLTLMEGIVDYRKDKATSVSKQDMYVVTRQGQKRLRKTTTGLKLLIKWKDQSKSWIPLKDMKECCPVEVTEFAKARSIADKSAFVWWVPYTLRKRDVILWVVKS
jgi:hypothetical protein